MDYKSLKKLDSKLYSILQKEQKRQKEVINLIPSENYVSQAVLEALGTVFTNKYAEGKSGQRYYFGNKYIDELEDYTKLLALNVFKLSDKNWSVNVQPYSGSGANFAVYMALLESGDIVLAMSLEHGGHLTHGHKVSATGQFWKFAHYGVNKSGYLDYDEIDKLAAEHKPKLIVVGASAYSRTIDFEKFSRIAKKYGAYLLADISHIAGLVVGGMHPSPFPYADIVTTTIHKTLRGPRAAIILSRKSKDESPKMISELIDKAVFPGLQGGPHINTMAAIAVALKEATTPEFKKYARQIVKNAQALAESLKKNGFKIVSGGTDNHLILVDISALGINGQEAGELLEKANIVVNKNMIPYDAGTPFQPSGIRLGTPAITTQGMKEKEMGLIAGLLKLILIDRQPLNVVKLKIATLTRKFKHDR